MPKPQSELPDNQVAPNPNLEKRTRRHFTTDYKRKILAKLCGVDQDFRRTLKWGS